MKTVQTVEIEKELDDLSIGWFDEKTEEWYAFDEMSEKELAEFCLRADFRKLLIEALVQHTQQIRETIGIDLESIWKRLDRIENENPD